MDRDVNAFQRIVGNQGGNEKAAGFWSTFRALEQYSNLFDCLHDTEDEMIKLFMELGYSNSELKQLFEVGGSRASRRNWRTTCYCQITSKNAGQNSRRYTSTRRWTGNENWEHIFVQRWFRNCAGSRCWRRDGFSILRIFATIYWLLQKQTDLTHRLISTSVIWSCKIL